MDLRETGAMMASSLRYSGLEANPDSIEEVQVLTGGHPYAIQLVGFHAAKLAKEAGNSTIGSTEIRGAVPRALDRLEDQLFRPAFESATEDFRLALTALAHTEEPISPASFGVRVSGRTEIPPSQLLKDMEERGLVMRRSDGRFAICGQIFADYVKQRTRPIE
jgi:hypothetical protein